MTMIYKDITTPSRIKRLRLVRSANILTVSACTIFSKCSSSKEPASWLLVFSQRRQYFGKRSRPRPIIVLRRSLPNAKTGVLGCSGFAGTVFESTVRQIIIWQIIIWIPANEMFWFRPGKKQRPPFGHTNTGMCVCVFSSHPFWTSMDVPAGVTQEEGHTGFLIHLPSAVRALIFVARRIQPFLSLVDREVEFCVPTN